MDAVAPTVGPDTKVLGGFCMISAELDAEGVVRHLNDSHELVYGEQDGSRPSRIQALEQAFAGTAFDARASTTILQNMWEKWVFIASVVGLTCLMRAVIGYVVNAGATDLVNGLLSERMDIAVRDGHAVRQEAMNSARATLTVGGSLITAFMLKDIERSAPIEADHIIGDLLRRGGAGTRRDLSRLHVTYAH